MRCPNCKQAIAPEETRFRPFCSERCKLIDLGRWLDGSYAIPGEPVADEDLENPDANLEEAPPRQR